MSPNGQDEQRQTKQIFILVSEVVAQFANCYKLLMENPSPQGSVWTLKFAHPLGGEAHIKVSIGTDALVFVTGHWSLDQYDELKRYMNYSAPVLMSPNNKGLIFKQLCVELATVLSWSKDSWANVSRGYEKQWGCVSRDEFYRRKEQLPVPLLSVDLPAKRDDISNTVVICVACGHHNIFKQPYPYHAGFGNQGFLYNESGNLTLIWSSFDKDYGKLFPNKHPWTLTPEEQKNLEKALLPAPKGGRWRFDSPARCLECGAKIDVPMLENIQYLIYENSLDTEKVSGGFGSVLIR